MKRKWIVLLTLMTVSLLPAATLSGTIKDTKTNKPLEFANIAVYEKDTETIKTGTMSGVDGTFRIFNVPDGHYYLVVTYMGYEKKQLDDIELSGKKVDVGVIRLSPAALEMDNVTVEAEKPAISYKIDKLVIDARQFITPGGSAVDILENVPLIEVDIEGDVSLRNRKDFTVMIDGRTSILNPQNALKIIPAETIENIEIMTNPSAKYEAEGGAGIINVVTKRNKRIGLAGLASIQVGTHNLSGSALVNYTNKKISAFVSFDRRSSNYGTESYFDRYMYFPDTTVNQRSEGIRDGRSVFGSIKGGLDLKISKNDVVGFLVNYHPRSAIRSNIEDYTISNSDPVADTLFNTNNYINYENSNDGSVRFNIAADYTHTFPGKKKNNGNDSKDKLSGASSEEDKSYSPNKHQMKFAAYYSNRDSENELFSYLVDTLNDTIEGKRTIKIGPASSFRGKFEYKRPINNTSHIETGAVANLNWIMNGNNVYDYDPFTSDFNLQDQYSYQTIYKQNTISTYLLYSAEFGQLGFQPGIRAEYTYREIRSDAIDSIYVINDLNIFPSLHLSYQFPNNVQFRCSYSKRITRPSGYKLEPFYTWIDAYNIRIGNPALKPQIMDSYEVSVMKSFGRNSLSLDAFFNQVKNNILGIKNVYPEGDNVILSTYENIGKHQSAGFKASANINYFSWWRLMIYGRIYHFQIEGELYGEDVSKKSTSYNTGINTTFILPTKTSIQIFAEYLPKITTAQGSSSKRIISSLGVSQNFFKGKLSASLRMSDVFGKGYYQNEIITPTTHIYSEYYSDSPRITLNLSLKINNYKRQRSVSSIESDGFDAVNTSDY